MRRRSSWSSWRRVRRERRVRRSSKSDFHMMAGGGDYGGGDGGVVESL